MFLPKTDTNNNGRSTSLRRCTELFGMNRQAKYIKAAKSNRQEHDEYVAKKVSEIEVGDTVTCRDGYGKLTTISNDSISMNLSPFNYEATYIIRR